MDRKNDNEYNPLERENNASPSADMQTGFGQQPVQQDGQQPVLSDYARPSSWVSPDSVQQPPEQPSQQQPNRTAEQPNQQQEASYTPYSSYFYAPRPSKPKKEHKEKRRFSLGVVVACCLICSLLGGVTASTTLLAANNIAVGNSSASSMTTSSESGTNTVINVDKSTTELISAIAEKVSPSVVGIRATASVYTFFGRSQESSGEGSGIVYTSDGYIITNYHVISLAVEASNPSSASISVYLPSDPETAIPATVVGYDSSSDLAVLKIEKTGLTAIEIGDSDALQVGETAVAIGNPGGLKYMGSVSSGIVSGLNRTLKLEGIAEMALIQTDAAINPGNSGGALVNAEGKLIGVNSSKISGSDYEGMGFAIPSNYVVQVCDNIINNKDIKKAYVGVTISTEYTSDILKQMGYPSGAVVESVAEDSPAANAGISAYDIITQFDGVDITSYSEYNTERLKHSPGDTIQLTIYRNRQYYTVRLTLGESNA